MPFFPMTLCKESEYFELKIITDTTELQMVFSVLINASLLSCFPLKNPVDL